ncbi:hypothetical protein [Aeromonas rivipollensis]
MEQKNVFMAREGNEWYKRNKSAILGKTLGSELSSRRWCIWAASMSERE